MQANNNFYVLLLIAIAGFILLAALTVLAVIIFRNRSLKQERAIQRAALEHQKALVNAAINSQEKERKYIGTELHDNIIHSATLLKLVINRDDKAGALQLSDKMIDDMRTLSHRLSPAVLTLLGMKEVLHELDEQLQATGIQLHVQTDNYEPLHTPGIKETELHLYRILQELTTNTLKYASAKKIYITLQASRSAIEMHYKDDGKGFDFANTKLHHNGVHNIQSRIQLLQAQSTFYSAPGKGVQVDITVPLENQTNSIT